MTPRPHRNAIPFVMTASPAWRSSTGFDDSRSPQGTAIGLPASIPPASSPILGRSKPGSVGYLGSPRPGLRRRLPERPRIEVGDPAGPLVDLTEHVGGASRAVAAAAVPQAEEADLVDPFGEGG